MDTIARLRKRDELFVGTDITEYTLLVTTGEIEKCEKEATSLDGFMRECEKKVAEGRRQLDAIYETRRQLLEFNTSRTRNKLQVVLEAMEKHAIVLAEKLIRAHDDVEERTMKEKHEKEKNSLDVKKRVMTEMYADCLIETKDQVAQFKMMSIEEKMKMMEAREEDSMEEEHHRKVTDAKLLIARVVGFKEKLETTTENLETRSWQEFHFAYINHLLEKIRLCLVILEQDIVDLCQVDRQIQSKVLKCLEDGKRAIQTITMLGMDRETSDIHAICKQLQKLFGSIENLQRIDIPEAKVHHHLQQLLGTLKV